MRTWSRSTCSLLEKCVIEGNDGAHMISEWCAIKVMGFIILLAAYEGYESRLCRENAAEKW